MKTKITAPRNIDEYIAGFPDDVQKILEMVRVTIRKAVPDAEETISYQMPTFTLNGNYLVYFAAFKNHVGFYPAPVGNAEFEVDLAVYGAGKGTAKFPFAKPIPLDLITKIVKFRVKASSAKAAKKPNARRANPGRGRA